MDKIKRLKELTEQLNQYRKSYYNNSKSLVSDKQYDNLFDELQKLEEETGIVMPNSPTKTVGYEVKSKLKKVKHSHSMLSLDKTKSVDDLKNFAGEKDCLLMCKMDGLTVLLTYENEELIQAETRGNGEEGEIITHNAKVFENIPLHIDYTGHLEIEGEAIITYDDFEKINSKLPKNEKYKNPRNLVSGSVRQLDSNIAAQRHVKFIAWKVPYVVKEKYAIKTMIDRFSLIEVLGFETVPQVIIKRREEHYDEYINSLKEIAKEKGFPIDGLVMTYNDIAYGESLGTTGHHPKHSLAFKFYDDIYPTKLLDVEFTMGKTGILTPTAIFEVVEIDGTIVERASLHNLSIMKELGITRKGQIVNVYKSNMIIPQIDSVERDEIEIADDNMIIPPETCPICGADTEIVKDNDTEVLICTNPNCKGKLLGRLSHFCSKNAMDIEGMSEATLQFLIDKGWVNSFKSIYHLEKYKDKWSKSDGFGKRSVEKLLQSIEKSRNTTLSRFIYALSIPLVGKSASKEIAKYFNNDFRVFWEAWNNHQNWRLLNDFGETMHQNMTTFIKNNQEMVYELMKEVIFEETNEENNNSTLLDGKTFVITGTLNHYANRNELVESILSYGGEVSNSVSKKTNYLICNDNSSNSSKKQKANILGVKVLNEEDFIKMIS